MTPEKQQEQNATAVISHSVKKGREADYEKWLTEIEPAAQAYPGHLGVVTIPPVAGATVTYTILLRFDNCDHLLAWMDSSDRKLLVKKVQPLLAEDDRFFVRSGLDFWFVPEGAKAKLPTRWKQFLLTWSVVYPLVLFVPVLVDSMMLRLSMPESRYFRVLVVTAIIVTLMIYFIMPRYTKLVHRWLFS